MIGCPLRTLALRPKIARSEPARTVQKSLVAVKIYFETANGYKESQSTVEEKDDQTIALILLSTDIFRRVFVTINQMPVIINAR